MLKMQLLKSIAFFAVDSKLSCGVADLQLPPFNWKGQSILEDNKKTASSRLGEGLAAVAMSKKRAGSASRPGTPANAADDSGSEDDFKPQQQQQQQGGAASNSKGKGKQVAQEGSKNGAGGASGSGGGTADDDMNTLDDAVGYAGVDLNVRINHLDSKDKKLMLIPNIFTG